MKNSVVMDLLRRSILHERMTIAALADEMGADELAAKIRAQKPPHIRLITHATVEKKPEAAAQPYTIVGGSKTLKMLEREAEERKQREMAYRLGSQILQQQNQQIQ